MIENEIIHTNATSQRILYIGLEFVRFVVVLVRVLWEVLVSLVRKILPPQLKDISREIVLITGTGHGIGRELACQYAALGCTVICVDVNEKGNEETLRIARSSHNGILHSYICDVSNREALLKLAAQIKIEVGAVSVLVNNAGIMPSHLLEDHTDTEIRRIFDINVLAHFWTLEAFLPHMKQKGQGHIIALSSIAGVTGLVNLVPYCASKFAVRGLMDALCEEIRSGPFKGRIQTTTIYPYMTNTGLCKKPKCHFPSILGLQEPKEVARRIIEAHRLGVNETTIPTALLHINNWTRVLPFQCSSLMKDFIDSGVESDL